MESGSLVQSVTCSSVITGRRVRFYRTGGDCCLNLCELQIYVCSDGFYGEYCNETCPTPHCQRCQRLSGQCTACNHSLGLAPPDCTECVEGYYREMNALGPCSNCNWQCYNDSVCDKYTGHCDRCPTGRQGHKCQQDCGQDRFGQDCVGRCGKCRYESSVGGSTCHPVTGGCAQCQPGFLLPSCTTECDDGSYGDNCTLTCGRCQGGAACDKALGHCVNCEPGWYKPQCQNTCADFWYGDNCSEKCGNCSDNGLCNKTNGLCQSCPVGLQPPLCQTACQDKTFGPNCSQTCGHCLGNAECHRVSGDCPEGCAPGVYASRHCTTACEDGWYGTNCSQPCGPCKDNATCSKTNGHCPACPQGKLEPFCTAELAGTSTGDAVGAVLGGVLGSVFAVVVAAVLAVFIIRRRKHTENDRYKNVTDAFKSSGEKNGDNKLNESSKLYANIALESQKPKAKAVKSEEDGEVYENLALQQHGDPNPQPPAASSETTQRKKKKTVDDVRPAKRAPAHTFEPTQAASEASLSSEISAVPPSAASPARAVRRTVEEPEQLSDCEEATYSNESQTARTTIRLDSLYSVVMAKIRSEALSQEFATLVTHKDYPVSSGLREENYYKNRFNSILPYDHTRVKLVSDSGDEASDYINANFVKGVINDKGYIAAQGPRDNTVNDFWEMIWQEGVTAIVMLTNLMEGNKHKCHEYWPSKSATLKAGTISVTTLEEESRAFFIIRTFVVRRSPGTEKRRVMQYHYVNWMDHEVPATAPLVDLWRYVRARIPRGNTAPPLLVHCSAGVGRTGTYIALDVLMDQAEDQSQVDIYTCVQQLREDRCQMVQNKGQYEFLHKAFLEAYVSRNTRITAAQFDADFSEAIRHDIEDDRIDTHFKTLRMVRLTLDGGSRVTATLEENKAKNRDPEVLPDDGHLVYIATYMRGRSQYINAVYSPTFFNARGCILTQLPLPDTVIDIWRMIDCCDVNTVVSIGDTDLNLPAGPSQETCRYWPDSERAINIGHFTVTLNSSARIGDTLYSYNVIVSTQGKTRSVQVLHLMGWTGLVAGSTADLVQLLTLLHTCQVERPASPVVIQCLDGASSSGTVSALLHVISRMTSDEDVDVYHAVSQAMTSRREAFSSVEQYRFCFEVIQQYRASENVYANT